MEIEFSHRTKIRVRYSETDQMGYCYHGNYAQYFEVGRVEALRELGMSYKAMESDGIMLPVIELNTFFIAPALYDDELTIITKISKLQGPRLFFTYEIKNSADTIISRGKTTLAFISKKTMKPISAPQAFLNLITAFEINKD